MLNVLSLAEIGFGNTDQKIKTAHWPSEAADCARKQWYRWTHPEMSNPPDATGQWKMRMGNAIHDTFRLAIERAVALEKEWYAHHEVQVTYQDRRLKYPISGRIDVVLVDPDKRTHVLEVKSTYGRGIRAIREHGPKPEALKQLAVYRQTQLHDYLHLVYISRDDGDRIQYTITEDQLYRCYPSGEEALIGDINMGKLYDEVIAKYKLVEDTMTNAPPPREYLIAIKNRTYRDQYQADGVIYKTDWQCAYCGWRDRCWQSVIETIDTDNRGEFCARNLLDQDS